MVKVPKKVADRLSKTVTPFQRILTDAKDRDVNESDTVTIITDLLSDVFGYDKYTEITSEQAVRGTYCDLAIKQDDKIKVIIEVKAIGLSLKESHLRQAVNYGANHGIPWVVLTNGLHWEIYRIKFERPIGHDLVCSFEFLELSARNASTHKTLYLLCKEGLNQSVMETYHEHVQVVNRHVIGALIASEKILGAIRRELRRLAPESRITTEELGQLLPDVLKRDLLEGNEAAQAKRRVSRASSRTLRKRKKKKRSESSPEAQLSQAPPISTE